MFKMYGKHWIIKTNPPTWDCYTGAACRRRPCRTCDCRLASRRQRRTSRLWWRWTGWRPGQCLPTWRTGTRNSHSKRNKPGTRTTRCWHHCLWLTKHWHIRIVYSLRLFRQQLLWNTHCKYVLIQVQITPCYLSRVAVSAVRRHRVVHRDAVRGRRGVHVHTRVERALRLKQWQVTCHETVHEDLHSTR